MASKTIILVTGANTGLGLEILRALAKSSRSYEIIVGCRTPSKGDEAIKTVTSENPNTTSTFSVLQVDLESDSSLEKAAKEIESKYGKLDVLVNNGGAQFNTMSGMPTREAWNKSWDVNVTGTHILTELLAPLLLKGNDKRLIFMTSGTSSLTETDPEAYPFMARLNTPPEAGWPKDMMTMALTSYRAAKTGMNMMMREWYKALKNDGVKVWAVSPGMLATGLGGIGPDKLRQMGALEPHVGGEFTRDVIEGKRDGDVGLCIRNDGVVQSF